MKRSLLLSILLAGCVTVKVSTVEETHAERFRLMTANELVPLSEMLAPDLIYVHSDAVVEDKRIWIETLRDIAPGEELAYDYGYVLEERHTPAAKRRFPCHCGAANCRGTMLGRK